MDKERNIKEEWLDLDIFAKNAKGPNQEMTYSDSWSDRWSDDCNCCVGGFSK